jgi:hypothetical protein
MKVPFGRYAATAAGIATDDLIRLGQTFGPLVRSRVFAPRLFVSVSKALLLIDPHRGDAIVMSRPLHIGCSRYLGTRWKLNGGKCPMDSKTIACRKL